MPNWKQSLANAGLYWPLKHKPYRGQEEFIEKAFAPHRPVEVVVLPTGYGKTICQILYAAFLMIIKRVRHVIVLVPRDSLRNSMVDEWQTEFIKFVPDAKILNGDKDLLALGTYARQPNSKIVLIASYQQINSVLINFTHAYACLVIADEAHHLYEEGVWARDTASLNVVEKMYFTATPIRGDKRPLHDAPLDASGRIDPLVQWTIKKAQLEYALCKIAAKGVRFWVDVTGKDGVHRVTTDTLEAEHTDFSTYAARRDLRFEDGFTTPLIEKMVWIHNAKDALESYKHQILVKAMTTQHADVLCQQINAIVGDPDFAHAVHIHKPRAEVDLLLLRFRGKRRDANGNEIAIPDDQRFPCLVQVDIAGEGYNNPYISTLVKADLTRGAPYITQLIGRALRNNYDLERLPQTIDVLIPDDDQATMDLILAEFEVEISAAVDEDEREGSERGILILDIPDVLVVAAGFVKMYDLNGAGYTTEDEEIMAWADQHMPGWRDSLSFFSIRSAYMAVSGQQRDDSKQSDQMSESAKRDKWRRATDHAVGVLAGNVIRIITNQPLHHNGNKMAGNVKQAINTQWVISGGTKAEKSSSDDFVKKHEWVKHVNDRVMQRDIPAWLHRACHE